MKEFVAFAKKTYDAGVDVFVNNGGWLVTAAFSCHWLTTFVVDVQLVSCTLLS